MRLHIRLSIAAAIVIVTTLAAVLLAGIGVTRTDPEQYPDLGTGLWWAVTTITTVGYGDVVPSSAAGRLVASLLMFVGVACVALLTAIATSAIVAIKMRPEEEAIERDELEILAELQTVSRRLVRLEQQLRTTSSPSADGLSTTPVAPRARRNWEDEI